MNGQSQRCRLIFISALAALGLSACFEGWADGHSCLQDGDCVSGRCRSSVCVPVPADAKTYYDAGPGAAGSGGTAGAGGSAGAGGAGGSGGSGCTCTATGGSGGAGGSTGGGGGQGGT